MADVYAEIYARMADTTSTKSELNTTYAKILTAKDQ